MDQGWPDRPDPVAPMTRRNSYRTFALATRGGLSPRESPPATTAFLACSTNSPLPWVLGGRFASRLIQRSGRPWLLVLTDLGPHVAPGLRTRVLLQVFDDPLRAPPAAGRQPVPRRALRDVFGDPTHSGTILDRLPNSVHRITLTCGIHETAG